MVGAALRHRRGRGGSGRRRDEDDALVAILLALADDERPLLLLSARGLEDEVVRPGVDGDRRAVELVRERLVVHRHAHVAQVLVGVVLHAEDDRRDHRAKLGEALRAVVAHGAGAARRDADEETLLGVAKLLALAQAPAPSRWRRCTGPSSDPRRAPACRRSGEAARTPGQRRARRVSQAFALPSLVAALVELVGGVAARLARRGGRRRRGRGEGPGGRAAARARWPATERSGPSRSEAQRRTEASWRRGPRLRVGGGAAGGRRRRRRRGHRGRARGRHDGRRVLRRRRSHDHQEQPRRSRAPRAPPPRPSSLAASRRCA